MQRDALSGQRSQDDRQSGGVCGLSVSPSNFGDEPPCAFGGGDGQ